MRTIDILQILRFVAALLVVFYHLNLKQSAVTDTGGLFHFIKNGGTGVDIFFVISGFIITATVLQKPRFNAVDFTLNRFFRIYPVYWVFLTVAIFLGYISYHFTGTSGTYELVEVTSLTVSYLLIPLPVQIYPVAWTLTLEITFYVIFCISLRFGGLRAVISSLLVWYLLARLFGPTAITTEGNFIWFFHSVVLEFLYGVLIAWAWLNDRIRAPFLILVVGCIAYAVVAVGAFNIQVLGREFTAGIPAALLVYGAVGIDWKAPRLAVLAGDSSYILYLIHPLIITVANTTITILLGPLSFASNGVAILVVVTSVIVSMLLTLWVEVPYIRAYKKFLKRLQPKLKSQIEG